jgi:transposase
MDKSSTIVGLDLHKKAITAAVLPSNMTRPREVLTIENERNAIARFVKRVTAQHPATFVYEAGPCGYEVHRQITALGYPAIVIAPAFTPVRPGDRVKTNRRDAEKLARLYPAGELTECNSCSVTPGLWSSVWR